MSAWKAFGEVFWGGDLDPSLIIAFQRVVLRG